MEIKLKRVVVADDHSLFLDGITSLLEAVGYEIVGQASNGKLALEAVRRFHPDLVLLDISMPEMDGLETLQIIKSEHPELRVVMLTVSEDDDDLFKAIQLGADGYLLKDLNSKEFIEMIEGLEIGEAAINRRMAAKLMSGFQELSMQKPTEPNQLTERELELLQWMVEGLSNKGIAEKLFISENTVKYHIRNILQKLGAQNRTEAVATAMRQNLIHKMD
jgi:DNA-binding NarL/FixJ family response regulator